MFRLFQYARPVDEYYIVRVYEVSEENISSNSSFDLFISIVQRGASLAKLESLIMCSKPLVSSCFERVGRTALWHATFGPLHPYDSPMAPGLTTGKG